MATRQKQQKLSATTRGASGKQPTPEKITVTPSNDNEDPGQEFDKLAFLEHILSSKFQNSLWLDGRINSLITLNSFLITAIVGLSTHPAASKAISQNKVMLMITLGLASLSLVLAAWLRIPRLNLSKNRSSPDFDHPNLRTLEGINGFSNSQYTNRMIAATKEDAILHTIQQIKMMNNLVMSLNRRVVVASSLSALALISGVIFALIQLILSSSGVLTEVSTGHIR